MKFKRTTQQRIWIFQHPYLMVMNVLALRCQMNLAKRINEAFSKKPIESKFKALAEKYCSPENCNLLTVPRVNPGIWNDLPRASKKLDVGLQEAQKSAVHAAQAITLAVESLIRCKKEKAELDRSTASRRGHYNYSFNKRDFSRGKPSHYKKDVENKV